ncbi:MAG TPA: GNAT family N-acetyltransferase [Jiangellaceae bacterium]
MAPDILLVRNAHDADMRAVQRIYAHEVTTGLATFEEVPPTVDEMLARRDAILAAGLPYLVAELDGAAVGYSYATAYRPRPAYRHTAEDSVYVAPEAQGNGVGRALLTELVARCADAGIHQVIAVIGNSGNAGSIALHKSLGFHHVGTLTAVGYKFGRWVDTVLMQRDLTSGG